MMRNGIKTLNDLYDTWFIDGGVFAQLQPLSVPWKEEAYAHQLGLEYHGNMSGDKIVSPLVQKLLKDGILTEESKALLATTILSVYGKNWQRLWDTLNFEYNPIENYNMDETMTDDKTVTDYGKVTTRTDDLSHTKTGNESRVPNLTTTNTNDLSDAQTGTDTTTPATQSETTNKLRGFNSTSSQETGGMTTKNTGTSKIDYGNTTKHTGTQTTIEEGDDTHEYNITDKDSGTQSTADTGQDTHTRNYALNRHGNIGVTTSQQMIESERQLWLWNMFFSVVFKNLDTILTLSIY